VTPPDWSSSPAAVAEWERREEQLFQDVFRPGAHLTPSQWAEKHRVISQGPNAGQRWSNEMTPYLVEIMDFFASPWARSGVVRKSARVGFTEGIIGNLVGYTIDHDPCPMAVVQPSDGEARAYSKEQLAPMLERNEWGSAVGETGSRRSDSTLTYKEFTGGFLAVIGSASDKNLRRRSLRRVFVDEVDAMEISATMGDPLQRLAKRTDDYEDGLLMVGSTPSVKGESRIDREFAKTDQRFWHVPCPHCEELQVLEWGDEDSEHGVKWDRETVCRGCGLVTEDESPVHCPGCLKAEFEHRHVPGTAHYVCRHCGEAIEEHHRPAMVCAGWWVATNPGAPIPGWHIDALISLFPGARWAKLVGEFLGALADATDLQVFWNEVLGLAFAEDPVEIEVTGLQARAEEYLAPDGSVVDVPDGVGVLTAAVDVHGRWMELLVRGWGMDEESWDILHQRIMADPETPQGWARLEGFLTRPYRHVSGATLRILCTMIDAGYSTPDVYQFVKPRQRRNVFAILGDRTGDRSHEELKRPTKANSDGCLVYTVGTYRMKDRLFRRLGVAEPGPGYIHLRKYNPDRCNGFDADYFTQFGAEEKRRQRGKLRWVQVADRNEGPDLHVYNQAAFLALGVEVRGNMLAWVEAASNPRKDAGGSQGSGGAPRRQEGSKWATEW